MTITYRMGNVTSESVNIVMLRKFFQMVFVGNDRKSLHIYTASVIGGLRDNNSDSNQTADLDKECTVALTSRASQLEKMKEFCMSFDFIITGNDNNNVVSIENMDITEGEDNFLSQIQFIKQVWGQECEVLSNNQSRLKSRLKELLGEASISEDECTASLAHHKLLWIHDEKKRAEGEHSSLAIRGAFDTNDYHFPRQRKDRLKEGVREGTERAYYRIRVPMDKSLFRGIELVNWVKTTICFRHKLNDSNFIFCIQKESEHWKCIAPDFTWYFSPPVKSYIDNESSCVEVRTRQVDSGGKPSCMQTEEIECTCPMKKQGIEHATTRYPNVINPVANKTTVNFKRWTDDEMIGFRQKYRLSSKNIFRSSMPFDFMQEMNIFLDTRDEHGRGNRQFVLSIFISFALAFGIDSSRLEMAKSYFPFPQLFTADAWWLFLLILFSLNLLIRPPHAISVKERLYNGMRAINIVVSLIWMFWVFILSKSQLLIKLLSEYNSYICCGVQIIYGLLVLSSIVYVGKNILKYHDPILSGIFSDDIL